MAAPNRPSGAVAAPDPLVALRGRRVVLGVTGGIAAYKGVDVCRRLVDAGAHVVPVLTDDAQRFIGALTFSALASEPARTSLFEGPDPIPHTRLGRNADLIVVAPATAKVIGKYTHGISDDLLTATLLATKAPVVLAPAMHTEMWEHAAVRENLAVLRARGVHVVDPEEGRLAGGDSGPGRLAEPERIVADAAGALADEKLKKRDGVPEVVLEPTPDVLAELGERKQAGQLLVGFAAETEHVEEHAAEKMTGKRVDMMVANDVSAADSGFEVDTNRAILLYSSGSREGAPLPDKH